MTGAGGEVDSLAATRRGDEIAVAQARSGSETGF